MKTDMPPQLYVHKNTRGKNKDKFVINGHGVRYIRSDIIKFDGKRIDAHMRIADAKRAVDALCVCIGVSPVQLRSDQRWQPLAMKRQLIMREMLQRGFRPNTASAAMGRSFKTVIYGAHRAGDNLEMYPEDCKVFADKLSALQL